LSDTNEIQGEMNLDTRILSNFIYEFNISLRHVASYPKNHSIIAASTQKVLRLLYELLEYREEILLAVARDTLMVEYALLDPQNPVYRNLAKVLFDHDIAAITFTRNATSEELICFGEIMSGKLDTLRENGGILQMVKDSGIRNILVTEINYRNFCTTEEDRIAPAQRNTGNRGASTLWENFAHGVLEGTLDPLGSSTTYANSPAPSVLAEMMNELETRSVIKEESYATVIASFMGELGKGDYNSAYHNDALDKMSKFVSKLNPVVRRQFLNGVFTHPGMNQGTTKEILANFPNDIILQALEDINSRETYTPPVTISLLQRLSQTSPTASGKKTVSTATDTDDHEHLAEKLRVIFREDKSEEFIPLPYQKALRAITSMNRISLPDLDGIEELRQTLLSHSVETQLCLVILAAMRNPSDKCRPEALEQNLLELINYLLETGDFSFLAELYNQLHTIEQAHYPEIFNYFTGSNFLDAVLDCLETWEKPKHADICSLIRHIGSPFVEPLLERLAKEQNMSLRRSYLDCLLGLGELVRDAALVRLTDSRWFLVRNLIIILRDLNDYSILGHIRQLRDHQHPRVRQEVIKTFQHFNHSEADRLLLQDLSGSKRELQLNAIQMAERSRCPEVFSKLLFHLNKGGVTNFDFAIKSATVRTLAQIKNQKALPSLMEYIWTKHLFRQNAHNRLKAEIIKSLYQFQAESALPLLDELAKSDRNDLRKLVSDTLINLQGER
jgi:HEAT repeat protein